MTIKNIIADAQGRINYPLNLLSAIATLTSVFIFGFGDAGEHARTLIIILLSINLILLFSGSMQSRSATRFQATMSRLHLIFDRLRYEQNDCLDELLDAIDDGQHRSVKHKESIQKSIRRYYPILAKDIKAVFDELSNDSCSVAIKILISKKGESFENYKLKTLARENGINIDRKKMEVGLHPVNKNTAYLNILNPENHENYFASDNLAKLKIYENSDKNWNEFYNATIVSPIRIEVGEHETNKGRYKVYGVPGFICVENKKGNLDNEISHQVLACLADSLYHHFRLFNELTQALYSGSFTDTGEEKESALLKPRAPDPDSYMEGMPQSN